MLFRRLLPTLALGLCACAPQMTAPAPSTPTLSRPAPAPAPACAADYREPDWAALQGALDAGLARWQAAGLQDYRYTFSVAAPPMPPLGVLVEVRGGEVIATRPTAQTVSQGVDSATLQPVAERARATMPQRFDDLALSLGGAMHRPCSLVQLEFDPQDGHPTRALFGTQVQGRPGDLSEWRVSDLRTVPGSGASPAPTSAPAGTPAPAAPASR